MEGNKYVIDGEKIEDKESLWNAVGEVIELPKYFGNNLDALSDVLQEKGIQGKIKVLNKERFIDTLGDYGKIFLQIIEHE
ncbi:MAG: barstar family protein [Lachnospiraceae bacterium]|nr:barstar family protein [Lachnospiraceae bacterium]